MFTLAISIKIYDTSLSRHNRRKENTNRSTWRRWCFLEENREIWFGLMKRNKACRRWSPKGFQRIQKEEEGA